jgi:hypothetical protein
VQPDGVVPHHADHPAEILRNVLPFVMLGARIVIGGDGYAAMAPLYDYAGPAYGYAAPGYAAPAPAYTSPTVIIVTPTPNYTAPTVPVRRTSR